MRGSEEPPASPPGGGRTLGLIEGARRGEPAALEELFTRLLPRVRKIVALRMGCRESELWEREDLVQETLLEAFRDLARFEPRHEGALCHWLATLVRNNLADHRRRRTAQKRDVGRVERRGAEGSSFLADSVLGRDEDTPSRLATAAELEQRVEGALLALDEPKRRVIELRKLCELPFDEIARELGFGSESSARSLYSRALAELADRLG